MALLVLLGLAPLPADARNCSTATVLWVHDGDTLAVSCGQGKPVKIRVADIDAPELQQAYGVAARDALAARVDRRQLILHVRARDRFGRTVATIELDGRDVGLQLVAEGLAWCGMRPSAECRAAVHAAQHQRLGLWTDSDPLAPWRWRRQHPQRQ